MTCHIGLMTRKTTAYQIIHQAHTLTMCPTTPHCEDRARLKVSGMRGELAENLGFSDSHQILCSFHNYLTR